MIKIQEEYSREQHSNQELLSQLNTDIYLKDCIF